MTKTSNNISINSKSNIIFFNREISEVKVDINNKLLISQRINDDFHEENNINTNNCCINTKYIYKQ